MTVVIDCDPGIDDALALLWATRAGLDLGAVTTVAGNADLQQVTRNALTILEAAGRPDIPVHAGAARPLEHEPPITASSHGADGLGELGLPVPATPAAAESAGDVLHRAARSDAQPLTIAAIGPLTNIAEAVLRDPGFAGRVDRLVVMGGAIGLGNVTPAAEFNFWHDPDAADIVLRAGFRDLDIVGLDVTAQVFMTAEDRERIRYSGELGQFAYEMTRVYFDAYWRTHRRVGAEMCDPLVIGHLLDPALLRMVPARVEIQVDGASAGRSNAWLADRYPAVEANCRIATAVDAPRFFARFLGETFGVTYQRRMADENAEEG